jgi:hypothetical protein
LGLNDSRLIFCHPLAIFSFVKEASKEGQKLLQNSLFDSLTSLWISASQWVSSFVYAIDKGLNKEMSRS